MTRAGRLAHRLLELPRELPELARAVQGLLLHEHWAPAYGVTLSDERRRGSQLRSTDEMLASLVAQDARSLALPRPLDTRQVGVCRHFAVLTAAALRAHGVPARARCGFGAYFISGQFEDHWVCEHWNAAERRWVQSDTQLDALQLAALRPDFDPLDVPRDRFLIAGDAWARCRAGELDGKSFGIADLRGLWFVAGNVVRDAAALCNAEMLPWDVWGGMLQPLDAASGETLAFLDGLAELTRHPDACFDELRALYASDARLRVPAVVRNALLDRDETP